MFTLIWVTPAGHLRQSDLNITLIWGNRLYNHQLLNQLDVWRQVHWHG